MDATFEHGFPADHPALAGHFPGNAIVPGVVLLDAVLSYIGADAPFRLTGVKFLHAVRPGDRIVIHCRTGTVGTKFECRLYPRGAMAVSGTVTSGMAE